MTASLSSIRSLFSRSFVLGGSPCSGKSTIAEQLAYNFDLPYYKVDDHQEHHLFRADQAQHPTMYRYARMTWDEIWSQPVEDQVKDLFVFYKERASMVIEDLLGYADDYPIIMEGAAFLPDLIHAWGIKPQGAVFLVPTKAFQVKYYARRPWVDHILAACTDPQQTFTNWMERDHRFGLAIIHQGKTYQYRSIVVDGKMAMDELYAEVKIHFGLV